MWVISLSRGRVYMFCQDCLHVHDSELSSSHQGSREMMQGRLCQRSLSGESGRGCYVRLMTECMVQRYGPPSNQRFGVCIRGVGRCMSDVRHKRSVVRVHSRKVPASYESKIEGINIFSCALRNTMAFRISFCKRGRAGQISTEQTAAGRCG